jgi:hypothetical protein
VPSHQLCIGFVHEQTFQTWYYRKIPHHLGRNSLLGMHPLNIAWIFLRDLIPTCFAYWTGIQNFILLTMIEGAVISTCMYLLCFQGQTARLASYVVSSNVLPSRSRFFISFSNSSNPLLDKPFDGFHWNNSNVVPNFLCPCFQSGYNNIM